MTLPYLLLLLQVQQYDVSGLTLEGNPTEQHVYLFSLLMHKQYLCAPFSDGVKCLQGVHVFHIT